MKKIIKQECVSVFFQEHKAILEDITPRILFEAIKQIQFENDHYFLLSQINKIINAYYNGLVTNLSHETREICEQTDIVYKGNECINLLKTVINKKQYQNDQIINSLTNLLKQYLEMISRFSQETFPKLHQKDQLFSGISLLAMYHDEINVSLLKIINYQKNNAYDFQWCNREFSSILFQVNGSIIKLRYILCPILTEQISK